MATGYPVRAMPFPGIRNFTRISVGWATTIHTEIEAIQDDYVSAVGSFAILASRLAVMRTSSGTWKATTISHGAFNISANQHHSKQHATSHLTGSSDGIPLASNEGHGYLSQTHFSKLADIASGANRTRMTVFRYTGFGGPGFISISLPFTIYRINLEVLESVATAFTQGHPSGNWYGSRMVWDWRRGETGLYSFTHRVSQPVTGAHSYDSGIEVDGSYRIKIRLLANMTNIPYMGLAWGRGYIPGV